MMHTRYWTGKDAEYARKLWEEDGWSARAIAEEFGKTRNAIIGLANRMGWKCKDANRCKNKKERKPKRPVRSPEVIAAIFRKREERMRKQEETRAMKEKQRAEAIEQAKAFKARGLLYLWELNENTCRNVEGDPLQAYTTPIFCGLPIHRGSYCKHHYGVNVQKVEKPRMVTI